MLDWTMLKLLHGGMNLSSEYAMSQNSAHIPNPKPHIPGGTLFSLS